MRQTKQSAVLASSANLLGILHGHIKQNMNSKLITLLIAVAASVIIFSGCGGGGGGGGTGDGSTDGSTGTTSGYSGRVVREDTTGGVSGVKVQFKNAGGTILATATTNASGNFSIDVPSTAVKFHLQNNSVPLGYYKQFEYNTKRYTTLDSTCTANLPAYVDGVRTPLATTIVITPQNLPPPPPPNGCGL